jgi:hypothetical protein
METMVQELKKIMPFKNSTAPGDVVLVAVENSKSVFYALVADIVRDDTRRDEWWHVTMHILSVPPQQVVWTLREAQFTGQETFTMAGDGRFMQAVEFPKAAPASDPPAPGKKAAKARPALKLVK